MSFYRWLAQRVEQVRPDARMVLVLLPAVIVILIVIVMMTAMTL